MISGLGKYSTVPLLIPPSSSASSRSMSASLSRPTRPLVSDPQFIVSLHQCRRNIAAARHFLSSRAFSQPHNARPLATSSPRHVQRLRLGDSLHRSVNAHCVFGKRYKSKMTESSQHPLSGLWKPTHLQRLYYGPESVKKHLLECLPSESSKAFIVSAST